MHRPPTRISLCLACRLLVRRRRFASPGGGSSSAAARPTAAGSGRSPGGGSPGGGTSPCPRRVASPGGGAPSDGASSGQTLHRPSVVLTFKFARRLRFTAPVGGSPSGWPETARPAAAAGLLARLSDPQRFASPGHGAAWRQTGPGPHDGSSDHHCSIRPWI